MSTIRLPWAWCSIACVLVAIALPASAASVGFSGRVFDTSGFPVTNGLVVVGTFAPAFDPYRYTIEYGDAFQNLLPGAYDMAVADGNFMPIATDLTNDFGAFFGLGSTTMPAGTPLWLFAFEAPLPDSFHQVLATSSNAAWQVPAGPGMTSLTATDLNSFVLGQAHPEGVALTVIPFPEPAACCLAACVAPALAIAARRRRESNAYAQ